MTTTTPAAAAPRIRRLPLLAAIVLRPGKTMRAILDHPPYRGLHALVVTAFVSSSLGEIRWSDVGRAVETLGPRTTTFLLLGALAFVPLVVILFYYVLTASALVAGRFLDGKATFTELRAAVAWGLAPIVWALVYRVPAALFWTEAFAARAPGSRPILRIGSEAIVYAPASMAEVPLGQLLLLVLLDLAVFVWTLIVASRCLAEAQRITAWKGLANLVLALVLPVALLLVTIAAAVLAGMD